MMGDVQFETSELERRYALVVEGHCPHSHGPLERRDEHGWCETCAMGWAVRGDLVSVSYRSPVGNVVEEGPPVLMLLLGGELPLASPAD